MQVNTYVKFCSATAYKMNPFLKYKEKMVTLYNKISAVNIS